ncbi:exostosin family-domain-containing protein [Gongronella butleri]|nr:exostosin family-domain-containing protein [Gongronella butleri]
MPALLRVNTRWIVFAVIFCVLLFQSFKYQRPYSPAPPLPVHDVSQYWPSRVEDSLCDAKIFVYDIPSHIQVPETVREGRCHESNYNSEIILYKQLMDPSSVMHKLYVTQNPDEATFFFVPFFGSCYLYNCWSQHGWNWEERCDVETKYVDPLMDYVMQEHPYWNASQGRNHLMVHPMDKTFTYYANNDRFQPAIFMTTVGDKRRIWANRHRFQRDIVIPSATRLIHHMEIDISAFLDSHGHPLNGKKRDTFVIFHGCCSDVQPGDLYSNGIRSLIFQHFQHYRDYDIGPGLADEEYALKLARAKYGLAPMGWTLDTTRIWEYIAFGVVPVVISDGIIEPFERDVDWDSFIVRVRRDEAHRLDEILRSIDDTTYEYKRRKLWEHGRTVGLEKDAWHYIVRELCRMNDLNSPINLGLGY